MNSLKQPFENTIVNKYKLIYIPLAIALFLAFSISIITFYISKNFLLTQTKQNGIYTAKKIAQNIEINNSSLETINKMLADKIIEAGNASVREQTKISNDFLIQSATDLDVAEINWYNSTGKIVYSNVLSYIDWQAPNNHPVITFSQNSMATFVEKDIRQVTDYYDFLKYGYVRGANGYFVQIGISANKVSELTEKFSYQHIVDELMQEDNFAYALIVDNNMKVIAHSQPESIGKDYSDDKVINEAITGQQIVKEWYYDKTGVRIFDISQPIFHNGKIIGAVNIGISMEKVYAVLYIISSASSLVAIMLFFLFFLVQNKNIIKPSNRLNQGIAQIDIENHIEYRLPIIENDTFRGLAISINKILTKTHSYFEQLQEKQLKLYTAKEDIALAYQQLTIAEEELRSQYDEIQNYAAKLEYNASHDSLTNLPNRRKLMDQLESAINNNQSGAVMLLDIDNFKGINDTLGHVYGDKVLKKVAEEFKKLQDEIFFVARLGGDEFLILIQGENDYRLIDNYAKKIINIFKNNLIIADENINVTCSIGIALYPVDSNDVSQLLMNADMAMYKVKNATKNNYMFFNKS